jgi:hypothetical protein
MLFLRAFSEPSTYSSLMRTHGTNHQHSSIATLSTTRRKTRVKKVAYVASVALAVTLLTGGLTGTAFARPPVNPCEAPSGYCGGFEGRAETNRRIYENAQAEHEYERQSHPHREHSDETPAENAREARAEKAEEERKARVEQARRDAEAKTRAEEAKRNAVVTGKVSGGSLNCRVCEIKVE